MGRKYPLQSLFDPLSHREEKREHKVEKLQWRFYFLQKIRFGKQCESHDLTRELHVRWIVVDNHDPYFFLKAHDEGIRYFVFSWRCRAESSGQGVNRGQGHFHLHLLANPLF